MARRKRTPSPEGAYRQGSRPKPERSPERTDGRRDNRVWLFGRHAVEAALANHRRGKVRFLATTEAAKDLPNGPIPPEIVERSAIDAVVPAGAVHQGLALMVEPLAATSLEDICELTDPNALVIAIDRVSDPHNVGAILRSAAAFGAAGVILPDRHAPDATGTLAKSASGALEHVPLVRVSNLVQALNRLKENGFWVAGLTAHAPQTLTEANLSGRLVLVIGAEGAGMRRLSEETCDYLVRIPMSGAMESLNMSNATAIALYALREGAARRSDIP